MIDIKKNRKILNTMEFEKVYCSALMRTQETAIFHGYSNYTIDKRINELNFGKYEGRPKSELTIEDETMWKEDPINLVLGESLKEFFLRIDHFFNDCPHSNILCFCHGAVMRYLKAKWIIQDINKMNKISIDNNEILTLDIS